MSDAHATNRAELAAHDDWLLDGLEGRLVKARAEVDRMAAAAGDPGEATRLYDKGTGIDLALEYVRSYRW